MAIKLDEARIRSLTVDLLNGGVALNSLNYGSYALPLAGGKMTGTIHLGSTGLRTHDDTHGYYTDQYGNFFHCSNTSTDNWNVHNAAGNTSLKYYFETGALEIPTSLKMNTWNITDDGTCIYFRKGSNTNYIAFDWNSNIAHIVGNSTSTACGYGWYNKEVAEDLAYVGANIQQGKLSYFWIGKDYSNLWMKISPTGRAEFMSSAEASDHNGIIKVINNSTYSGTGYHTIIRAMAPKATGTQLIMIGPENNVANAGYMGFYNTGISGSADNRLSFGLYAVDNVINIMGNGKVGVGTITPSTKFVVYSEDTAESVATFATSGANPWIYFKNNGTTKVASVGYYKNMACLSNEKNLARIGVTDTGIPQYWTDSAGTAKYEIILGNAYENNVGPLRLKRGSGINNATNNYISAGRGYSTGSGLNGLKLIVTEQDDAISGLGQDCLGKEYELSVAAALSTSNNGYITFVGHKKATPNTYSELGHFDFGSSVFYVNGKIGVGVTAPTHTVEVSGTIATTGIIHAKGGLRVGDNANGDTNYIAFYGTTGDQPGDFNHTYIGENLYAGGEKSELVLFKGNDVYATGSSDPGPERIRHIAAQHLFQTYSSALNGSWTTVCDSTLPVTQLEITPSQTKIYQTLLVGDRIRIWSDGEGGNIRLYAPNSTTNCFEWDVHNGSLRLYYSTSGGATASQGWAFRTDGAIEGSSFTGTSNRAIADAYGYNIYNNYNKRYESSIDLTAYDTNTWYPVTISLPSGGLHRIACTCHLNTGSVPSWSAHTSGFTAVVEMLVTASGWGTTGAYSICLTNDQRFITDTNNPPVGYTQFGYSSKACFYCRGGGKYIFQSDFIGTWVLYATSTEVSSQTIAPSTTYPGLSFSKSAISANLNGTASTLGRSGDIYTPMTFYWSGQSGQPSWLWGGNDGSNMYVYNPSNFNVNSAAIPAGFTNRATSSTWGAISSSSYTLYTEWDAGTGSNPGAIAFMAYPSADKLSVKIDGYYYQNEGAYMCLDTNNYSSYALPKAGGTMNASAAIKFTATPGSIATSDPMSITYGRIAAYGTLYINANTDNSGTEYVVLTAGKGHSNSTADGLAVGTSTLTWQNADVVTSSNYSSWMVPKSGGTFIGKVAISYAHTGGGMFQLMSTGSNEASMDYAAGGTSYWVVGKGCGGTGNGTFAWYYVPGGGNAMTLTSGGVLSTGIFAASNRIYTGYDSGIAGSVSCSNWFRSNGATGWYNATYDGGWYMSDTTWVRTHNSKGVYTGSGQIRSDRVDGGMWITGTHQATFVAGTATNASAGNYYQGWYSGKTQSGAWSIGALAGSENLYFVYGTDENYNAGTNTIAQVQFGSGGQVYGAVWNDYAEYRTTVIDVEPGRVVIENNDDTLSMSTERLMPGANIVSDTFGFAIGKTDEAKTPLTVSGRVLAYPLESREEYHAGDPVCSGPNGTVSKMTREEVMMYPDRIIGTVSSVPNYDTWGTGNVKVNGRIWIKVR